MVIYLNSSFKVIHHEILFQGTIDGSSVHPRVVVQRCLELSAAAVIFSHNHPSGNCYPSKADIEITKDLVNALKLFDIKPIDHIIIGNGTYSFSQNHMI